MSIYDPIASIAKKSITKSLPGLGNDGVGLARNTASRVGNAALKQVVSVADRYVSGAKAKVISRVNKSVSRYTNKFGLGDAADLLGKLDLFGLEGVDSNYPIKLLGGLSFSDMAAIHKLYPNNTFSDGKEQIQDNYCLKNLFLIEIEDKNYTSDIDRNEPMSPIALEHIRSGVGYSRFNLLCRSVSHAPTTIQGGTVPVGSVEIDSLEVSGRTEMQVVVMDDTFGSVKNWARAKAAAIDGGGTGLFGIPADYLFTVKVIWGTALPSEFKYYNESFLMRLGDIQHDLDRSAHETADVQLKFVQWDACMFGAN